MHCADTHTAHPAWRRSAFAALAALLLAAAITGCLLLDGGWWQLVVFGLGPDLALLAGMGSGLAKGQLHPRAVLLYNSLHSYWGPLLLALAAFILPAGFLIGALAWAFHISLDRTVGYGKRTRDGFQRS